MCMHARLGYTLGTNFKNKKIICVCVHSIALQLSMQEVTLTKADKIAYNVGGQFLTLQALVDIQ